ncbi:MAG: Hsp70 family protein [Pirellula sp.]|nr:Hsp70 family protein [Pirellula sp.]
MIVGIDLGTTNSLCAIFQDGKPQLIPNAHGGFLTPSVVAILQDGSVLIGDAAKEMRVTQPDRCASRFKRLMGSEEKIEIAGKQFTAPQLSSLVLRSLKTDAEHFLGETVDEAVITVPAYFNDNQRRATKLAGEMAGFQVRRIVNEPTAAALTYGFHDRNAEKHLMVIDLGGGTFDVTIMEVFEGALEIVATSGESMLGGEDFTDRLVSHVLQTVGKQLESAEMRQPLLVSRLRQACEQAKIGLARNEAVDIRIPTEDGLSDHSQVLFQLRSTAFLEMMEPLLARLLGPIQRALRDSERSIDDIDEVIFVGGATRMPCLSDFLSHRLGVRPRADFNPDEVVALGAAVQAALISEDRAVDDMVMTDVCPHTLGVEIMKELGGQRVEGYFSPVIHRNTTIPVSKEGMFSTVEPNQYSLELRVFQGEGRKVKDNLLLGTLHVTGIPPGPAGSPIAVRFTYDTNGILEVEAIVPSSGKRFSTVLAPASTGLTKKEIDKAVREMQQFKFYPRDEVENQRLLLFCERIVGEVSPFQRQELEAAIDVWEQALSSGDREFFESTKAGLLVMLSSLGFPFIGGNETP